MLLTVHTTSTQYEFRIRRAEGAIKKIWKHSVFFQREISFQTDLFLQSAQSWRLFKIRQKDLSRRPVFLRAPLNTTRGKKSTSAEGASVKMGDF